MNSDTNLYTLSKRVLDDFIALNSFRWRKEAQKTGIANSQYLKRTQKHIIYSISIFFFSQVCGVLRGFFYPSFFSMFFWNFIGLFFAQSCELYILHFLFTLVLIFSLQQKNYDGNDDYEDDNRNAESDNHDQSVVVGWGICCWKLKKLIITFYWKFHILFTGTSSSLTITTQNSVTTLTEFSIS